jgi:predicted enzyme related to lactoylglutathione lyase
MAVRLHHVVVDAHDLPGLARFWAQALGWRVLSERAREVVIGPDESAPIGMCFMPVPETKTIKNRVHLDLTTGADDRDAEIERLLRLGARRVNIGQTGDESWTVLADPEGNEFCVVRPINPHRMTPGKEPHGRRLTPGARANKMVAGNLRNRTPISANIVTTMPWLQQARSDAGSRAAVVRRAPARTATTVPERT